MYHVLDPYTRLYELHQTLYSEFVQQNFDLRSAHSVKGMGTRLEQNVRRTPLLSTHCDGYRYGSRQPHPSSLGAKETQQHLAHFTHAFPNASVE